MDAMGWFFLLLVPATYLVMLSIEWRWPARSFPPRAGWQWLGAGFLVLSMAIGTALPLFLPVEWMAEHRLVDGTKLGVAGGALVGFLVLELFVYVWHRSAHQLSFMWRAFHQMHHSPQRVDVPGALVFHPLETAVYTFIPLVCTVLILGLEPLAAAITGYLFAFAGIFQHWNVRTPQWFGYVLQRPESHCVHHRRGMHYYNFADLPLWDILFGTFRNPRQFMGECGFDESAERRLGAMLGFADVNEPLYGARSRGVAPAIRATLSSSPR